MITGASIKHIRALTKLSILSSTKPRNIANISATKIFLILTGNLLQGVMNPYLVERVRLMTISFNQGF